MGQPTDRENVTEKALSVELQLNQAVRHAELRGWLLISSFVQSL